MGHPALMQAWPTSRAGTDDLAASVQDGACRLAVCILSHWAVTLVLALLPGWVVGVCARDLWKPDEPREAAIAARMARPGSSWVIPHLATRPFCEKPPLTYWAAAGSARLLGTGIVSLRLPNLVFGLLGALLVASLARHAAGPVAGLAAGLLYGTTFLAYRVGVWLATDALLMLCVAGALLGCLRGLQTRPGPPKLAWYTLMHFFLACGFLTKNIVAWIVPALAWLTVVVWERRWRELIAWEFLGGTILQAALITPWLAAVASQPDGTTYLRIFFRNNLLGRFIKIEGVGFTTSHAGWAGKYLTELPVFLLPWTLLVGAWAATAWQACGRAPAEGEKAQVRRTCWRFATGAVVPPLALLSAAASMRDVYAGILMPGLALLGGMWAAKAIDRPNRWDLAGVRANAGLFVMLALLLPPALMGAAHHFGSPTPPLSVGILVAAWMVGTGVALLGWRSARRGHTAASLTYAALLANLAAPALGPLALPMVNRAQNLRPVALAAQELAGHRPLALLQPDETIIAVMDYELGLTPPLLMTKQEVLDHLAAHPDVVLLTRDSGRRTRPGARLWEQLDLDVLHHVDLPKPGGRSYLLLGRRLGHTPTDYPGAEPPRAGKG